MKTVPIKSKYIIVDGPDGSGKTTVAALMQEKLEAIGYKVVRVREFDATETNKEISKVVLGNRMDDLTRLLLVSAMRKEAFDAVISPALAQENTIVLADRGWPSTYAYQCKNRDNKNLLQSILSATLGEDAYVAVLITEYETSRQRMQATGKKLDVIEQDQDAAEYGRLVEAYSKVKPNLTVDTTRLSPAEVADLILQDFSLEVFMENSYSDERISATETNDSEAP